MLSKSVPDAALNRLLLGCTQVLNHLHVVGATSRDERGSAALNSSHILMLAEYARLIKFRGELS